MVCENWRASVERGTTGDIGSIGGIPREPCLGHACGRRKRIRHDHNVTDSRTGRRFVRLLETTLRVRGKKE